MRRAAIPGALAALALLPAAAPAATLTSTPHGALDLGDRVAFHVDGPRCSTARAKVRLTFGSPPRAITGATVRPLPDAVRGGCSGAVQVPGFGQLRDAGWQPGAPIGLELTSTAGTVPLRFARREADAGAPVAGSPAVVPAGDQDTGEADKALALDQGDAVSLGRVDLRRVDSVAVRLCVAGVENPILPGEAALLIPDRLEPPVSISLRQGGAGGPALVGPVDVANSGTNPGRLATFGFGGCYRLVVLPVTGRVVEDAPELVLRVDGAPAGALKVNSVDVAGTAAKASAAPEIDPPGMRTIFDGTSFAGFSQTGCALRDGAAVNARSGPATEIAGCAMAYDTPLRDVVVRLRVRREHFYDNAGIYLGDQEIQMRSAGEFLPGGYFGQFAARWQKLNSFPAWSTMEIVQLGARHVVTVNGRTVTDVLREGGAPQPFRLRLVTQPEWSMRGGTELGFGNEGTPDTFRPSDWGAFWFDDVRLLACAGADDP
ncbi:MAG TPA: family 16 glycoside hydrolase, partial [Baekduia sp.]|nr:family 16 glycoside hydrolase [Baekduia sp.]